MALAWPDGIKPRAIMFHPENVSRSGGAATNGQEQVVTSGSGRWRAAGEFPIFSDDQVRAWRAFIAAMEGRAGTVLVPAFDGRRASWPVDAYDRTLHPGFTRRPRLDDTAYEDPEIPAASEIVATVNAAAAIRATQIGINVTQGSALIAGQYFGIGNYLYLIRSIVSLVGTVNTVTFWPGLRVAATLGETVKLTRPVCEMRFTSDNIGELMLESLRFGSLNLEFVEAF